MPRQPTRVELRMAIHAAERRVIGYAENLRLSLLRVESAQRTPKLAAALTLQANRDQRDLIAAVEHLLEARRAARSTRGIERRAEARGLAGKTP